jgi:hypothetical protein
VLAYDRRSLRLEMDLFYLLLGDVAELASKVLPGCAVTVSAPSDQATAPAGLDARLQKARAS